MREPCEASQWTNLEVLSANNRLPPLRPVAELAASPTKPPDLTAFPVWLDDIKSPCATGTGTPIPIAHPQNDQCDERGACDGGQRQRRYGVRVPSQGALRKMNDDGKRLFDLFHCIHSPGFAPVSSPMTIASWKNQMEHEDMVIISAA
jgi:hypothetical protein